MASARLTIDKGIAYGEPFDTASGSLRFEGNGVRIDGIEMRKSGGTAEGAAFVGWNGTYSFNATGRRIPMESVKATAYPQAKLTGFLEFNADGTGTFDVPRYQFRGRIRDLFVADEGVGEVTGRLDIRGDAMTVELEAASPRLAVSGTGRIDLTEAQDADITLRFTDTSLDPYARAVEPRISPFTTAVGSGTLRIIGQLANRDRLVVDMMFDQLQVRAFDYPLRNAKPIHVLMSNNVARIDDMRFIGDGTELDVTGTMDMNARRVAGLARGRANLGLLQGFYRNIRSSGNAELTAQVSGSLDAPVILGRATIENGRLRYFSLPHSLEQVNGTILFDSRNIRLDGLTARVADGQVNFDGRIGLEGYAPADLALTASGRSMRLRYPEGVRSEIDADLSLTGRVTAPVLAGLGDGAERALDDEVRHRRQPVRLRRGIGRRDPGRGGRGVDEQHSARASGRPGHRARDAAHREQQRARLCRAPTCSSAAPTKGRSSSDARRSRAASSSSRGADTS